MRKFSTLVITALMLHATLPFAMSQDVPSTQPSEKATPAITSGDTPADAPANAPATITESDEQRWSDHMVHMSRHLGHQQNRDDPRRLSLRVLAFNKLAVELNPRNADAWLWQYDLLSRMDRPDEARIALTNYVALAPQDESAALQLLALDCGNHQTAEARGAWLAEQLRRKNLPKTVRSDIHRRLAEFYWERGDREQARKHIERALRYMPLNLPARELAYDAFSETEPLLQRIELALQLVRINPGQVNVLWELGQTLDRYGQHDEARKWFERALETHRRATSKPIPPTYWYDIAYSLAASEAYSESLLTIQHALDIDSHFYEGRFLKVLSLGMLAPDDEELAKVRTSEIESLNRIFTTDQAAVLKSDNRDRSALMAWFYAHIFPQRDQAFLFAQHAMNTPYPTTAARRAMGFALLLNDRPSDAEDTFRVIADVDQYAALGLGIALDKLSRKQDALAAWNAGFRLRENGFAAKEIVAAIAKAGGTVPETIRYDAIAAAVQAFDTRIFDYYRDPSATLRLTMQCLDESVSPAGPIRLRLKLENINPSDSFSVTFGPGLMVQPRIVISASLDGKRGGVYSDYTEVLINEKPILAPGESIEKIVSVDVGRMRDDLIAGITETHTIEFTALLDPVRTHQGLVAGQGSVFATPARTTRPAQPYDDATLESLVDTARNSDAGDAERIDAIQRLGALLASRNRQITRFPAEAAMQRLNFAGVLADAAKSNRWTVRSAAIEALTWTAIDFDLVRMLMEKAANDPNPVARFELVQLGGQFQQAVVQEPIRQMAQKDSSHAVQLLARTYLPSRAAPATSAPGN